MNILELQNKVFFLSLFLFSNIYIVAQPTSKGLDFNINIGSFYIDPLNDSLQILNKQIEASPKKEFNPNHILQFNVRLNKQQRSLLQKKHDLNLDYYLQGNAYLERITTTQLSKLRTTGLLRWFGPYQGYAKIDPRFESIPFDSLLVENNSKVLVVVETLPGISTSPIISSIEQKGIEVKKIFKEGKSIRLLVAIENFQQIRNLAKIRDIMHISSLGRVVLNNGNTTGIIQSGESSTKSIWDKGLFGQGQVISVIDRIIDMNHCFFRSAEGVDNTPGPSHRKVLNIRDRTGIADDTYHGTIVSATATGEDINNGMFSPMPNPNNGHAPKARLVNSNVDDIIDVEGGAVTFYQALSDAASDGAFIHNNSWSITDAIGYTNISADVDRFIWENENHIAIVASLNEGTNPRTGELQPVWPPSNAKNTLVVNNSQFTDILDRFTYDTGVKQFTADGRIKPDLISPGADIRTALPNTECDTGIEFIWDGNRIAITGTSLSSPAIAGLAALTRQYFQEGWYPTGSRRAEHGFTPTGALLKGMLINASRGFWNSVNPSRETGWGQPVLEDALYFESDNRNLMIWDKRHRNGISSGEVDNYSIRIMSDAEPLRITLVWNDPPGFALASNPVINNLDLEIIGPGIGGREIRYFGNQMNPIGSIEGGTFDNRNNVESVILRNPVPGTYSILIHGREVNIGRPGQGYALVANGDFENPPQPTGPQNTLVARVGISDISSGEAAEVPDIINKMIAVQQYLTEASYSTSSINYEIFDDPRTLTESDPIMLSNNRDFYFTAPNSPLIELTEEVIIEMLNANRNVFGQETAETDDDIDRLIIITNDDSEAAPWSTSGLWSYPLPDGSLRQTSVSVLSAASSDGAFNHAICQQLGLIDLHPYPPLFIDRRLVDKWDNMAEPYTNNGHLTWSKQLANWINAHESNIRFIPRPTEGSTFSESDIGINFVTSAAANTKAIAIGLTPGILNIENERVFYFIEAREQNEESLDGAPEQGVIIYYVNEDIPQGFGPVKIIDTDLSTPDNDLTNGAALDDAALTLTDNIYRNLGIGLTIEVGAGTSESDFDIDLNYSPPTDENDVHIRTGQPVWTSPDIWVDAPPFTDDPTSIAEDNEMPIPEVVNRIYFRIHNSGAFAGGFNALIRVSEPYHTVNGQPGGTPDFNVEAGNFFIPRIDEEFIDFVEWTPENDGDPHSCIEVFIPNVFNDINGHNNRAQQNVKEDETTRGSPYELTTYNFSFTNSESTHELFYFKVGGIPLNWSYTFSPEKAFLAPGERIEGTLRVQPPEEIPICTEYPIQVTSYLSKGETLLPYGGSTLQVNLRDRTNISFEANSGNCTQDIGLLINNFSSVVPLQRLENQDSCMITVNGCTNPTRPFEIVVVEYRHPSGYPIFKEVLTDARGCFSDFYTTIEGGTWTVRSRYPGNDCNGQAISPWTSLAIPLPSTNDQDNDGLLDNEEPQGDHDGDQTVGIFDTDSDNDKIPDGQEKKGCVTNPDCNNNGILDGNEVEFIERLKDKKFRLGFYVGSAHPIGDLDDRADANIYARLAISTPISDRIRLLLMGGISQFTTDGSINFPNPRFIHGSLNAQYSFLNSSNGTNYFIQGGGGNYKSKLNSNNFGFNIGTGGRIIFSKPLELEFGLDFHQINDNLNTKFISVQLGVLFK